MTAMVDACGTFSFSRSNKLKVDIWGTFRISNKKQQQNKTFPNRRNFPFCKKIVIDKTNGNVSNFNFKFPAPLKLRPYSAIQICLLLLLLLLLLSYVLDIEAFEAHVHFLNVMR